MSRSGSGRIGSSLSVYALGWLPPPAVGHREGRKQFHLSAREYDRIGAPVANNSISRRPHEGVALQLYTVRGLAARDLLGTLEQVAATGYRAVEFAGLHGVSAEVAGARCDELGLARAGAHMSVARFESEPDAVAEELRALGTATIVFPALPQPTGLEDTAAPLERLAAVVASASVRGLRPVFHNHTQEFERDADGQRIWDGVVAIDGLDLELDLGWAWVAGEDPATLLAGLRGRVPLVHVKDHVRTTDGAPDCPVGEGEIDYERLIPAALEAGAEWLVVEQDEPGRSPLDAIARSLAGVIARLPAG